MRAILLLVLWGYRSILSPLMPSVCRYFPSCSQYGIEAIEKHGAWRGARLFFARLLRCHPGHPGGVDPVP